MNTTQAHSTQWTRGTGTSKTWSLRAIMTTSLSTAL